MPGCTGAHGAATRTRCLPAASAAMTASATRDTADAVVVGGGTIGAWCAWFLRRAGLAVVLVERASLGRGASSRAAWMVRLGMWTQGFYRSQREEIGVDSGFVPTGYLMPVFDEAQVDAGRARVAMQRSLGLDVAWLSVDEADALLPAMATRMHVGGSYAPGDGYVDPPRNVAAYTAACVRDGVDVREGTEFVGLRTAGGEVRGVVTSRGEIASPRVVLTGGPELASVGERAGTRIFAGAARHQVAVTEPHPSLEPERIRMAFDLEEGMYWRPEDGGVLFGMSNPVEPPGPAREVDWPYLEKIRQRLGELLPATRDLGLRKVWAATIEFTSDHLPILGPARAPDGSPVGGTTVACAAGHGMMWGPAVARVAADLALEGRSDVIGADELGPDRFDAEGRSRLSPDPVSLPYPERTEDR